MVSLLSGDKGCLPAEFQGLPATRHGLFWSHWFPPGLGVGGERKGSSSRYCQGAQACLSRPSFWDKKGGLSLICQYCSKAVNGGWEEWFDYFWVAFLSFFKKIIGWMLIYCRYGECCGGDKGKWENQGANTKLLAHLHGDKWTPMACFRWQVNSEAMTKSYIPFSLFWGLHSDSAAFHNLLGLANENPAPYHFPDRM